MPKYDATTKYPWSLSLADTGLFIPEPIVDLLHTKQINMTEMLLLAMVHQAYHCSFSNADLASLLKIGVDTARNLVLGLIKKKFLKSWKAVDDDSGKEVRYLECCITFNQRKGQNDQVQ